MALSENARIATSLQNTFGSSIAESNRTRWQAIKQKLESVCHEKKAEVGDYICHEGAPAEHVFLPEEGMFLLERTAFNGKRQVFAFLFPGNLIGLTAGSTFSFSARCLSNSLYLQISKKLLNRLLVEFPEVGQRYRDITQKVLAKILDQMFVLGQKTSKQRLAHFILEMDHHSQLRLEENEILLPMQRVEIADYLGMTLETTSRIFTQLKQEGFIHLKSAQHIKILDRKGLEELIEY